MAAQNGDVRCNLRISRHGVYKDLRTASTPAEGDGTIFEWFRPFNHERITNEACSLELISRETTIPVPRLVDYGVHEDGREFLFTERVKAVLLSGTTRYAFQNGDFAPHIIMIDKGTLEVVALVDWEFAGYFPAGREGYQAWIATLKPSKDSVADTKATARKKRRLCRLSRPFTPKSTLNVTISSMIRENCVFWWMMGNYRTLIC
ncbi:hypothetical protein MBM_06913 [Drepanopeziza brunnea f. sp. 'multigermtubi' MB_m1]|uniref:Aminoglycoside phosphotransferase domain-containing protein n=1 Tax=Marssonina brunnea f. sp. multigermtubi (strain MB_m1) TaxID=1072389 RepID=K1WQT9_MARBU|nr:uncharacterized protein MBM_06913 [Drepanopeziza brunnea f. sp. 'multigermtubi' MB_m1]EKD14702.1 hypothetical protein MBM_06913 [Drepanopeziza brunnea f. sp. 'multigermtubi' MB_m1]